MILIVADTGPINYLVQIGHVDVLPRLVARVILPVSVQAELLHSAAPVAVRVWATDPPPWVEIRSATRVIQERDISAADCESIALAQELNASFLLMDDRKARKCAARLAVKTMGTLGLLEAAAAHHLISLPETLRKLRGTSCFLGDEMIEDALQRDRERRGQP